MLEGILGVWLGITFVVILSASLISFFVYVNLNQKRLNNLQKHYENEIEGYRKKYYDIINTLDEMVIVHSLGGDIIEVNNSVETILGFSQMELMNKPVKYLLSRENLYEWENYLRKVYDQGQASGKLKIINSSGHLVRISFNSRIIRDEDIVVGVQMIARQVDEWEAVQNEGGKKSRFNFTQLDALAFPICIFDEDEKIIHANNLFLAEYGSGLKDIQRNPISELFTGIPPLADYRPVPLDFKTVKLNYKNKAQSRTTELFQMGLSYFPGYDQPLYVLQKSESGLAVREKGDFDLETVRRHYNLLSQFCTLFSHDMNNVLADILGFAELIEEQLPDGTELAEHSGEILSSSRKGLALMRRISGLRHASGMVTAAREVVDDLKLFVSEYSGMNGSAVTISDTVTDDLEQFEVHSDTGTLKSALSSLMQLFQTEDEKGGNRLHIRLSLGKEQATVPGPGQNLIVEFMDSESSFTWHGLKINYYDILHKESINLKQYINLILAWGVIDRLGGKLHLNETEGPGSAISIAIPLVKLKSPGKIPDKRGSASPNLHTVLLVDDEQALVKMQRKFLERSGYNVMGFDQPQQALDIIKADRSAVDIIITDLLMPDMSGIEFCQYAQNYAPDVPVIVLTGQTDGAQPDEQPDNVVAFLEKPVDPDALLNVLSGTLSKKD